MLLALSLAPFLCFCTHFVLWKKTPQVFFFFFAVVGVVMIYMDKHNDRLDYAHFGSAHMSNKCELWKRTCFEHCAKLCTVS